MSGVKVTRADIARMHGPPDWYIDGLAEQLIHFADLLAQTETFGAYTDAAQALRNEIRAALQSGPAAGEKEKK